MDIQAWIGAASAVLAASAFIFSVWVRRTAERDAELRNWQRVVIYSVIEEVASIPFEDIKAKYLQKAQQLLSIKIPRKEIQDDSLRRILLDLQKEGVIIRTYDLSYQVQDKVPMEAWAVEEIKRMQRERTLKPKVLAIVEAESGIHTSDTIARRLHELGVQVSFEELDDLIYELRGHASLRKSANGKLHFVPPYGEIEEQRSA